MIALVQDPSFVLQEGFGACEGPLQRIAGQVAVSGAGNVLVPGAAEGVVKTNALEAVVEADGPVELGGSGGEEPFGEVEETGESSRFVHGGWMICHREWRLGSGRS